MRIGELANECGVTAKTARYCESIGAMGEPERTTSGLSLSETQSVLELKDTWARRDLTLLAERVDGPDPSACTDSHRRQIIGTAHH